jgi:uncharacterized membrane protein
MRNILKNTFLFLVGGTIYFFIEILFRSYSHPSMFICGGLCFVLIGLLNETKHFKLPLLQQMFLSSIIITILELITGLIVNIWLKLDVWDYSFLPFNYLGQICILYTIIWFFLSIPAILLNDYLRCKFFNKTRTKHKII